MKLSVTLFVLLLAVWFLWSGHSPLDHPFLALLGIASCAVSVWLPHRMKILDSESVPMHLGLRPFTRYAPWLLKEIIESNVAVARIILSPVIPMQRTMISITAHQKTELGRVILANSITLTPGTVSVDMQDNQIMVHALHFEGAEEDLSGEMDRRVCWLEGSS